ncbi:MAG: heparinase II/III family protein [Rhodospirillales bacterium]|nr:heparinase II/III family protein [Rhodospirillales bacterium]
MPVHLLQHLKRRASHMAYNSMLYNWSLQGEAPERIAVRPVDPWAGSMEAGHAICEGRLLHEGAQMPFGEDVWFMDALPNGWMVRLHGFSWLRDLRALSGERGMSAVARTHAKMLIRSWCAAHERWDAGSWRMDITGERLAMWISAYEFFSAVEFIAPEEEEAFQDVFFDSCMRQARHLSRALAHEGIDECSGARRFQAVKGLLYAGIAFEGYEGWREQALEQLEFEIDAQIAGDGAHRSRSPAQLLDVLQILLDIRTALRAADLPLPEKVQHAIDRMGPALRFFRYNDKHLALFHGAQEGDAERIDAVLSQAGVRGKTLSALPCSGYERLSLGRTCVMMDCTGTVEWPYGSEAHASPLAFEMTYGRSRLFVNCGAHPLDENWRDALRSTPAHTALSLDARNACEVRGRRVCKGKAGSVVREDLKHAAFLEAAHEGYVPVNGFTHKRRIYICDQGHDVRGEDVLSADALPARPVDVAVRFHLHPRVMVSLIRDGQEALLRLPGGVGWRFHLATDLHQCMLSLEDSVYLGEGVQPRKTKQLVIYGQLHDKKAKIKWAVQREG